jgi:hypothetical protein
MSSLRVTSVAALVANVLVAVPLLGCGDSAPPPKAPVDEGPSWADLFEDAPDIHAVVRPNALRRDAVYGALWTSLVRAAEARGFVRGSTMLEAASGASEIVFGLSRGDAVIVLRGVPASLDPQQIRDASGNMLFRTINDRGRIAEYELMDRRAAGSLFVLPGRTWVGVLGDVHKARRVFSTPARRPPPKVDDQALAAVRVSGPAVRLFEKHPQFGALTKKLSSATFALRPGKDGLVVTLAYADADAVAWGEMHAKKIAAELAHDEARFGWLKDAKIAYEGNDVVARVAIPPRLLQELPTASGSDLGL